MHAHTRTTYTMPLLSIKPCQTIQLKGTVGMLIHINNRMIQKLYGKVYYYTTTIIASSCRY